MAKVQDIAELLVASWVLSHGETEPAEPLPATHGLLDRALNQALDAGAFPESWRQRLHFVDSRVGLKCVELSSVISAAQGASFTSDPNPSYEATQVKVLHGTARRLLRRHAAVTEEQARAWGTLLRKSLADAKTTLEAFPNSTTAK